MQVSVKLSSIHCYDEADGIGNAEPYLWTIFFKIDGETIKQNGISLRGDAVFAFGSGSHENLNTHAVEDGDNVSIPSSVGEWSTTLQPIIVTDAHNNAHAIPGTIGVAVVLMEEDNVSDSGAEAGHQALNNFVRSSINDFIHNLSLLEFANGGNTQELLNQKIAELVQQIKSNSGGQVETAIKNQQPWYNNAWAFLNADDNIGSEVFIFNQDDIVSNRYSVSLQKRWKNEGDWEIFGSISSPDPCLSFRVAVNKQKQLIKVKDDAIASIRKEMVRAPANLKSLLQQEINEIEAEKKPLEDELTRLRGLLNKCYARQALLSSAINSTGTGGLSTSTH